MPALYVCTELGVREKFYDEIPTTEMPLGKGQYFSLIERIGTLVHSNPFTLQCGASTAEVNFGHDLRSHGVGGLHIAEVTYRAFSIAELQYLRDEAHKLLGNKVINLATVYDDADDVALEEALRAIYVLLSNQRQTLNEERLQELRGLLDVSLDRESHSHWWNRKYTLQCIVNSIQLTYRNATRRHQPVVDPEGLDEVLEMLVGAFRTNPEGFVKAFQTDPDLLPERLWPPAARDFESKSGLPIVGYPVGDEKYGPRPVPEEFLEEGLRRGQNLVAQAIVDANMRAGTGADGLGKSPTSGIGG